MAFGNKVTELTQIAIGTTGYVVRIDTTSLIAYSITGVQAQASASDTPEPVTSEVSLNVLMSYLNDTDGPDLAFYYGYGEVYIYFNTTTFPYVDTTRFILIGKRNPLKATSGTDKLDIADKDLELFMAYAIKYAAILSNEPIPYSIEKIIREKELEIENANS